MIIIRNYQESDSEKVGRLIAETFGEFNLSFASPEEKKKFLGPFWYANSTRQEHKDAIAEAIRASMVFVAESDGEILGVLRGRRDRMQSLFVSGNYHRQGIGRRIYEYFERECVRQGLREIKVAASLYAVPFYKKMGYKKTTGIRSIQIFDASGFPYQPMKKNL